MILVTGSNERYQRRVKPYLDTLVQYADFDCYHVGVGYTPELHGTVKPLTLTREQNAGAPPETECIQHGSFLRVLPEGEQGQVVMYTDGDFTMQRGLNADERLFLKLTHAQVAVGYNGGESETLLTEYGRLSPKKNAKEMDELWGEDWFTKPIYNVGCVAMTRGTWDYVHRTYMKNWQLAGDCFVHQARQQWLLSYIFADLDVKILPWSLHAHGHFGLKPGMEWRDGQIYHDGKLALFRHYL
ncbi:MAG: hypothetical protein E6Q97_03020 [Desulfurellales bacterium]|nr:MAG: hypothetical protein E6Q97_03020 [Desulfurellales bacterium]